LCQSKFQRSVNEGMSFPFSPSNRQTSFVVFLIEFLGVDIAEEYKIYGSAFIFLC
jgi:hypothetical protein